MTPTLRVLLRSGHERFFSFLPEGADRIDIIIKPTHVGVQ